MEVGEAEYLTWRHHPVSKVVHKFLEDFAESLKRESWAYLQGTEKLNEKFVGELIGRARTCLELADLPYSAIEQFYKKEEDDDTKAV